ncbi:sigma-54 interaction domain-containing protein [Haloimpatiens sp. FM7315]|uniref:sigma-54 interaction domain-containing protein n=1 Tax=Haloimpatiens sp. FM7315 TaxID=3298609 RepID=UPI00370A9C8A
MFDNYELNFLEQLAEGVMIFDEDFKLVFMNDSLQVMHDLDKDKCLGKEVFYIYPKIKSKDHAVNKTFKEHKANIRTKDLYINYKGEEFINLNSSYPIYKNNKFKGIINVVFNSNIKEKNGIESKKTDFSNGDKYITKKNKKYDFIDIVGKSSNILDLKQKALKASKSSSPILIYGETGVGKELFVQSIHYNSWRKNGPLISQNCAAIPRELFESIMFGTIPGGFTGSINQKGLFELSNFGTLYLDELNSMPLEFQGKLLRIIQDGKFRKVGGNKEIKVDVRIIASLNEKPEDIIEKGKLRKDLYYRLNVIRLNIPSLRNRREDIPMLIEYFILKYNEKFNSKIKGVSQNALRKLMLLDWPGNVRQLQYAIENIFNFKTDGIIGYNDLPKFDEVIKKDMFLKERLFNLEKECIIEELILNDYNVSKTSKKLGIPRQTLQYKIKKFNIEII